MSQLYRITIEPGKRSGQPRIRGIRMTVKDVLGYLTCMSREEILDDFPDLEPEDIDACLEYAELHGMTAKDGEA